MKLLFFLFEDGNLDKVENILDNKIWFGNKYNEK